MDGSVRIVAFEDRLNGRWVATWDGGSLPWRERSTAAATKEEAVKAAEKRYRESLKFVTVEAGSRRI